MPRLVLALCAIILFFSAAAIAAPRKPTGIGDNYPIIMRSTRALGMGNAFTAMPGTDAFAQYYNPAAINDYDEERRYDVGAPQTDFTPAFFELVGDLLDLKRELHGAATSRDKIDFFDRFTARNTGDFEQFITSMPLFHVRQKHYAAGVIADARAVISLRNKAFPNFEFKSACTAGLVGGSALGFFGDTLQLGGNLKFLFRTGIEDQITTGDILNSGIKQLIGWHAWDKGVGGGADLGLKYKLPLFRSSLKPTVSLVVQDVADSRFTGSVAKMPMSVTMGAGIFPTIGGNDFAFLVDFREINQRRNFLTKFHVGMEAKLPRMGTLQFAIRGGCNQGYPAFGLSAAWPFLRLDFAFYGEEAGQYTSSKADYHTAAQLAFDF